MNKELQSLTGIRGIAALWVVLLHYRHAIDYNKDWYIIKLVTNGFIAVDLFFLLSAFVMCLAYSQEFKIKISTPSYITFIKKRFVRIYPAYFVWIFMFLCFEFIKLEFDYSKIAVNVLLIQNLFNDVEISFVFWSLCSEWILYLIFPFLYFILQKNENSYLKIFLIIISVLGIYILPSINNYIFDFKEGFINLYAGEDIGIIVGINSIIRCLFSYVIGINLFLLIKDSNAVDHIWAAVLKYCAIVGILIVAYWGKTAETYALTLVCSIVLISALYFNKEKADHFFASKSVYFLGLISYSIYLSHMFVLIGVSILSKKFFSLQFYSNVQPYLVIASLVILIPVSYLSYRFIEVKTGGWLKSRLL